LRRVSWSRPDLLYPAALGLGLLLPFDVIRPLADTPLGALTGEKLILALVALAWLAQGPRARPTLAEWRAVLPALALLGVMMGSALFAPDYRADAFRFVVRMAVAVGIMLVAVRLSARRAEAMGLLWALVVGAGLSALVGLAERLAGPSLQSLLSLFKVAPTTVGGEVRVSGSFQYATIAAMYFEMIVPLAIVLAVETRRRPAAWLATGIAALCTANVVLSLTRAGMLTLGLLFGILIVVAARVPRARRMVAPTLTSVAVLGAGLLLLRSNPVFDMRLATESDAEWYGAQYTVPPALQADPAATVEIPLDVRNAGRLVWTSAGPRPFALGFRWLTDDGASVLDVPAGDVSLPRDVAPGETVHLQARIAVPPLPAGTYRLDWGMLQRDVLRFDERGWTNAQTQVAVQPSATTPVVMPAVSPRDDGEAPWVVGRLSLWTAALQLVRQHPLLGVGPDNFRHFYGGELGLETWDERVQANNLYLELLADLGPLGLAAFLWLSIPPLLAWRVDWLLGCRLGVLAFLAHGLLDSFLAFTTTALLFAMLLGILRSRRSLAADTPANVAAVAARTDTDRTPGGTATSLPRAG
jgi:hypothetical protein